MLARGYLSKDNLIDSKDTLIVQDIIPQDIPGVNRIIVNAVKSPNYFLVNDIF